MPQNPNKMSFEWTISLGNIISMLAIVSTVGSAVIYVGRVEARVAVVESSMTIRSGMRDRELAQINTRLDLIDQDIKTILRVVTKDPSDEQSR